MRSAIASMPSDSEVQKAPVIYKTALYCILFSSMRFLTVRVPLKNHS